MSYHWLVVEKAVGAGPRVSAPEGGVGGCFRHLPVGGAGRRAGRDMSHLGDHSLPPRTTPTAPKCCLLTGMLAKNIF